MALFKAESMVRVVGFLLLLVSGQAMAHQIRFDSCKIVSDKLSHCLDFLEGSLCKPSNQCCQSIYDLNAIARVVMGPRFICQCIENVTTVLPTRIRPDRIGDLTVKCDTGNSFAISEYMDCNSTKKFEPENPTTHYDIDIGYERQHLPWFSRLFPYSQDHPRLGNYGDSLKNVMLRVYSGSIRRNKVVNVIREHVLESVQVITASPG
ncbi:hypothetical protein OIU77_003093 [Salix suchowensis]|uniref:Bifunctional inhibitor/plant lipid transfer protein/seed storage helical domain-containing protein n=1 Tax=Salix suchowensis TaxID=1278906 RepID=A0ABQ9AZN0_9ROSI|nr:hypothetical protein OIU77_003093 [Salix suchowensis]